VRRRTSIADAAQRAILGAPWTIIVRSLYSGDSHASRLAAWYVSLADRRAHRILAVGLATAALAAGLATRLSLHPDMAELLPESHPAVAALRNISGRQKSSTNLVVLIDSPDAAANRRFAQVLRQPLEALVPSVLSQVQWAPDAEVPAFANRWGWLYSSVADLETAADLLDRVVARRLSPLYVDLEGDAESELRSHVDRLQRERPARGADPDGFVGNDGARQLLGIMLWRRGGALGSVGDHEMLQAVRDIVARVAPARFHPQMTVRYTGPIAMTIEEHNSVRHDLTLATTLCTALVLLALWLYFRRLALVVLVGVPAVLGLLAALAIAALSIHYLNANTAFLISIILGNGINAPIVLLARYGEERRAGAPVPMALTVALRGTFTPTGTAMAAASIAYASLLATSFRGFSQFGVLGGAGMLLVWLATFALVPPLVMLGERWWPGLLTPAARNPWRSAFSWLGRLASRRAGVLAAASLVLAAVAALLLVGFIRDPLEWDFRNLRGAETAAQRDWALMYRLGMGNVGAGHIGTDAALLVDRPDQADAVAEALRAQDRALGPAHILRGVRTLNSVLPDRQAEKLALLARIRSVIDRHLDVLDDEHKATFAALRPPDYLRALGVEDLPATVRESFTEIDGTRGRLIGIDAEPRNFSDWNGHDCAGRERADNGDEPRSGRLDVGGADGAGGEQRTGDFRGGR